MSKAKWALMVLLVVFSVVAYKGSELVKIGIVRYFGSMPQLKTFGMPGLTHWKPTGCQPVREPDPVSGYPVTMFRTLHGDTMNSDEVAVAIAPVYEQDWVAEPEMYVVEGPTYDKNGNLYFCPIFSKEHVLIVSLEPHEGKRRWVVPGFSNGGGAPLVLDDPESGGQIIYIGTYDRVVAVRPDGGIVWDVPTGLPALSPDDDPIQTHCFGLNYQIQADALIGVTGDGHIYAIDRMTGRTLLDRPFSLSGSQAPQAIKTEIPPWVHKKVLNEMMPLLEGCPKSVDPYFTLLNVLLGGMYRVTNYFAVDANSGRLWVNSTAPDGEDGKQDGVSEYGALYAFDMIPEDGQYLIREAFHVSFEGGSASTPALNGDGSRIYVGDNFGKLFCYDTGDGKELWQIQLKHQVFGSIAVSSDNHEIYASNKDKVFKIVDEGDEGRIVWASRLEMYNTGLFQRNFNLNLATIGANGIVIQAGAGMFVGGGASTAAPFTSGVGFLDRETGELLYFAEGREETVAVMSVGPTGTVYLGQSPIRRATTRVLFGNMTPPLIGGIAKYKPKRLDLLMRDALHAALTRAENAGVAVKTCPESARMDMVRIGILLEQCRTVAKDAIEDGDLSAESWRKIASRLPGDGDILSMDRLDGVVASLKEAEGIIRASIRE